MTLFGRPAKQGDSGLVPQRTILPQLELRLCKRRESKDKRFLVLVSLQIPSFLQVLTGGTGQEVSCELNKGILA